MMISGCLENCGASAGACCRTVELAFHASIDSGFSCGILELLYALCSAWLLLYTKKPWLGCDSTKGPQIRSLQRRLM